MAVIRQANLLGQQRIDVPHLRAVESGVAADFDLLAGQILAGHNPLVVQGFNLIPLTPGTAATSLQLNVAGGVICHPQASESGTIFQTASGRTVETLNTANTRVSGGFTASAVNYIGLDLRRSADSTTSDLVQFLDPNSLLEKPKQVPLARTLDYVILISTADFSTLPGVAPLAKVTTDANNNIVSIQDARSFLTRLGSGGTVPLATHSYPWPGGRAEVGDNSDFTVGDKAFASVKDWFDAVMTRLWEGNGGEYWYSATADRNVQLVRSGAVLANGEYFSWDGTNLTWQGLRYVFDNSTAFFNDINDQTVSSAGLTDLAEGQCVYVDLDRTTARTRGVNGLQAVKATLTTLGTPTVPGARQVIAWRTNNVIWVKGGQWPVGTLFTPATTTALGVVKLLTAANVPNSPVVPTADTSNSFVVAAGISRSGTGGSLGAGTISVGTGANDTGVLVGKVGTQTTVAGNLVVGPPTAGIGVAATGGPSAVGVQGTGGTTAGIGVQGQGTGTGQGGDFTGGATGPSLVTHQSATANTQPQYVTKDTSGNNRWLVDRNGYPMGRVGLWSENWQLSAYLTGAAVNATGAAGFLGQQVPGWYYDCETTDNTVTLAINGRATSGLSVAQINFSGTSARSSFLYPAGTLFDSSWTNLCAVVEWYAYTNLSTAVTFYHGLVGNPTNVTFLTWGKFTGATNAGACKDGAFFTRAATANWQCVTQQSNVATTTDSGVAWVSGTLYSFRIEVYGSGTPQGAKVLFYINNNLVATNTTNLPASILRFSYGGNPTATGAQGSSMGVGGIRAAWNLNDLSIPAL